MNVKWAGEGRRPLQSQKDWVTKEQGGTWATGPGGYLIILGLSAKKGGEFPGPLTQPLM